MSAANVDALRKAPYSSSLDPPSECGGLGRPATVLPLTLVHPSVFPSSRVPPCILQTRLASTSLWLSTYEYTVKLSPA